MAMKSKLTIQNLKCGGCANTIIHKISAIDNISKVEVDVETSEVTFEHLSENDLEKITQKLAYLGYPIEGDKNSVVSKAKSFVSCASGRISN